MAPTEIVANDVPTKAGSAGYPKKCAGLDESGHCDTLPRMTPDLLLDICKERHMWTQPHLNTQLFLNYKGFLRIEGLEDYINVRALHLDNNNIAKIEGLDRMTELRSLHLGGNRIQEIEGLESAIDLRVLNLEGNGISRVANVQQLVKLEQINLSANRVENLEDLAELRELLVLTNIDISQNLVEAQEGVVEFWAEFKQLKVLRYHGNPGVRHVSHYRKRIVNSLLQLSYMDERPVFPVERKSYAAWAEGGVTAMHEAKKEFHKARHAQNGVDPERREFLTNQRKKAIERMDREEKERKEKEEAEKRLVDEKAVCQPLGNGKKAEDGDWDALQDYEAKWQQKVNLHGVDAVRSKVTQEMGGRPNFPHAKWDPGAAQTTSAGVAPVQREHDSDFDAVPPLQRPQFSAADFDFAPPSRGATAPEPDSQTAAAASCRGRRRESVRVGASDFCQRSSGEHGDLVDRQLSVLGDGEDVPVPSASAIGTPAPQRTAARGNPGQAAADGHTMPLIWEQRQAENSRAEAECMEQQNLSSSRGYREVSAGPSAFRSGQLEGLD